MAATVSDVRQVPPSQRKRVTMEEISKLTNEHIPSPDQIHKSFAFFWFAPRFSLEESRMPMAVISMFDSLDLIMHYRIKKHVLAKFVLTVRKGYRDPPYHNWMHAFSVAHFCYLLVNNLELVKREQITQLECLALMVACLCHDLDHRGTTNSFQVTSNSVLAALYSSDGSVMERHHFAQAMCILNAEGCNVLENLPKKEYTQCLDLVRDMILATDLATHIRLKKDLRKLVQTGYDPRQKKQRSMVLSLIMTACDLSDQTKDWLSSKKMSEFVYQEFFSQGDLERDMGRLPMAMMDREKACIPELQINFIVEIAQPVYNFIAELFPWGGQELKYYCDMNLMFWQRAKEVYLRHMVEKAQMQLTEGGSSARIPKHTAMDIFQNKELENEVLIGISSDLPASGIDAYSQTSMKYM